MWRLAFIIIASFFIGSIPSGYLLVKKLTGKDVREYGSGNIGSTNVSRIAGKRVSYMTMVIDILKGLVPVLVAMLLTRSAGVSPDATVAVPVAGFFAILGHDYTPFLVFRGGKGVNTTVGVFLAAAPLVALISAGVYLLVVRVTRLVSAGSLSIALVLPFAVFLMGYPGAYVVLASAASLLLVIRHRENLIRLLEGRERKVG